MRVLDAVIDMLTMTYKQGKWTDGHRFFVQVRAYRGNQIIIRLYNMETGITYDRIYEIGTEDEGQENNGKGDGKCCR